MSDAPTTKPHPLSYPIPGWLDSLFANPGLLLEYEDYLEQMLNRYRDQQDSVEDIGALMKLRGAIMVLKEQLQFIAHWNQEKSRRTR